MSRKPGLKKVVAPPVFMGFKPYGCSDDCKGSIDLLYEEYEAVKLADYKLMTHQEAGAIMGISRPTFARIYESARRKIARALVEAKEIKTVYGNVWFDKEWYFCQNCKDRFILSSTEDKKECPHCHSRDIVHLNQKQINMPDTFKIAIALTKDLKLPEDHFGESEKFLIYAYHKSKLHSIKSIPNLHRNDDKNTDHGSPIKGNNIASLLKNEDVKVVVSRSFGKNIRIISKFFLPVLVQRNDIKTVTTILEIKSDEIREAAEKHLDQPEVKALKI